MKADCLGVILTFTLRGVRDKAKMRYYREWGLASILDVQSLFFFIKENWICTMTRHHAESRITTLLTRKLLFDTDTRQWSHPLMIPLHVCGINRTIEPVVNLNVTWLALFLFLFHSFICTVRLLFHSLFRQDQVNLLVYGPDRPYFKQK